MRNIFIFVLLVWGWQVSSAHAALAKSFPPGLGSTYNMTVQGQGGTKVSIYVARAENTQVAIEYFIENKAGLLPIEMWQQFELEISGQVEVKAGYLLVKEMKAPEKMTAEYLQGFDGVQVNDFLFQDQSQLEAKLVGEESIQIPAGKTKAKHYQNSNNGQKIDYWISDEIKPLGLVKLVSQGSKDAQNYVLELAAMIKGVKAKIDPKLAGPLTDVGKAYLAKAQSVH